MIHALKSTISQRAINHEPSKLTPLPLPPYTHTHTNQKPHDAHTPTFMQHYVNDITELSRIICKHKTTTYLSYDDRAWRER